MMHSAPSVGLLSSFSEINGLLGFLFSSDTEQGNSNLMMVNRDAKGYSSSLGNDSLPIAKGILIKQSICHVS